MALEKILIEDDFLPNGFEVSLNDFEASLPQLDRLLKTSGWQGKRLPISSSLQSKSQSPLIDNSKYVN